ncbi:leucine-rich repeat protein [Paenibacillaceae bacterium WGS1546]|uniref:leucine-rich repeat protein n=1 Tax=Cohnella sp. WGS1546 TaxID=3366810 RepID=UPI00372D5454
MKGLKKYVAVVLSLSLVFCYSSTATIFATDVGVQLLDQTSEDLAEEIILTQRETDQEAMPRPADATMDAIHIADKSLELAIREKLNKLDGTELTAEELLTITDLQVINAEISSLDSIQYLTNLRKLILNENNITDISLLSSLQSLTHLELKNNQIHNVAPLSGLSPLKELYLGGNPITDYSPLAGIFGQLTGKDFALPGNNGDQVISFPDPFVEQAVRSKIQKPEGEIRVRDVNGITDLSLVFNDNLSNLEGIQYFTDLKSLTIWGTGVKDISHLEQLKKIETLKLDDNQIEDISVLGKLTNIKRLDLADNQIQHIDGLSQLQQLESLTLSGNQIQQITALSQLSQLRFLILSNNQIEDITPLANLTGLWTAELKQNRITDIGALSNLKNLYTLYLSGNLITDFTPTAAYYNNLTNKDFSLEGLNEEENIVISFPDPFVEQAVRSKIQKPEGEIRVRDVNGITDLSLVFNDNLSNLEGIQYFTDLKSLTIWGTGVKDISHLEQLKKIETLKLDDNQIEDISVLGKLTNIKRLDLADNQIQHIDGLSQLQQLESLTLSGNQIQQITALSQLSQLRFLILSNNQIEDITPLANLTGLWTAELKQNRITDIGALSNLKNLYTLYLSGNLITDFTPTAAYYNNLTNKDFSLEGLNEEENIVISFPDPFVEQAVRSKIQKPEGEIRVRDVNGITDLSLVFNDNLSNLEGIQYFTDLKSLTIWGTGVKDISHLEQLKKIETLKLDDNQIEDISVLGKLTNIKRLDLADNQIQHIDGLSQLQQLESLTLSGNQIQQITALSQLSQLRYLILSNNQIEDITPLASLTGLWSVELKQNRITDIQALSNLTNLRSLHLSGNLITDFTPTAAYYNNLSSKDFTLTKIDFIPIISITVNPEKLVLTVGDQPAKLRPTIIPTNATFNTLLWSSSDEKVAEVSREGDVRAVGVGTAAITVHSLDQKEWAQIPVTVHDKKVEVNNPNQTIPVGEHGFTVTVTKQADNTKLQYDAQQVNESLKVAISPLIKAEMQTSAGQVEMLVPHGTLISGAANWDGSIMLPAVRPNNSVSVAGATSILTVIEVGLSDQELLFDQPVRLVIPGQAGRKTGYIKQGKFHPIDQELSADTLEVASREIIVNGEAKINVGKDLIIWTKHFTTFVAYDDQKVNPPGPGPGPGGPVFGGGGGIPTTTDKAAAKQKISKANGGVVSSGAITVKVLPNSVSEDVTLTVEQITGTDFPAYPSSLQFMKEAYKLSTDKVVTWNKAQRITIKVDSTLTTQEWSQLILYQWSSKEGKWKELSNQAVNQAEKTISGELADPTIVGLFLDTSRAASEQGEEVSKVKQPSDIKGHWAESAIIQLVDQGIVQGLPDGTFAPNQKVTRAEFTTFLVRALGLEPLEGGKGFDDIANHWARDAIAAAYAKGIVSGYSDKHFGANDRISREQMAVMLVKALELKPATAKMTFKDADSISKWAQEDIITAIANGILAGITADRLQPQGEATRAEAAAMIVRAFAKTRL